MGSHCSGIRKDCTPGGAGMIHRRRGSTHRSLRGESARLQKQATAIEFDAQDLAYQAREIENQFEFQGPCIGCPRYTILLLVGIMCCNGQMPDGPRAGRGGIMSFVVYEIDLVTGKIENPNPFSTEEEARNHAADMVEGWREGTTG